MKTRIFFSLDVQIMNVRLPVYEITILVEKIVFKSLVRSKKGSERHDPIT